MQHIQTCTHLSNVVFCLKNVFVFTVKTSYYTLYNIQSSSFCSTTDLIVHPGDPATGEEVRLVVSGWITLCEHKTSHCGISQWPQTRNVFGLPTNTQATLPTCRSISFNCCVSGSCWKYIRPARWCVYWLVKKDAAQWSWDRRMCVCECVRGRQKKKQVAQKCESVHGHGKCVLRRRLMRNLSPRFRSARIQLAPSKCFSRSLG